MIRRVVLALGAILILCGLGAWAFLHLAERSIAVRMRPPVLEIPKEPAADFPFTALDGTPRRLSDFRGRVVVVDLWGTWCIQCVVEMPQLQKLYGHFRNDPQVQFLVISRMDTAQQVRSYASRNRYDLPFFLMADDDIPATMRFHQFPSTFVYAKDGSLVAEHAGAADWSAPSVVQFLQKLRDRQSDSLQ